MDWDIKPMQVAEVLKATAEKAQGFDGVSKDYAEHAENAVRQARMTLVGQACGDVITHYKDAWPDIVEQIQASLTGARDATIAYVNGQNEMALNAQRRAVDAPQQRRRAETAERQRRGKGS